MIGMTLRKLSIVGRADRNQQPDLDTFEVSLQTTLDLAPLIPQGCVKVSESGILGREEIGLLRSVGIQAALVGTSIMKSEDRAAKLRELAYACCQAGGTDDQS